MINPGKFNIIFHIKSKGSSNEWNPHNFYELAKALPETHFNIMLSGTREEGEIIAQEIPDIFTLSHVKDISGVFTLREFIAFIQGCDGLLASSTGPLHIAAISGKHALGLYPNQKPMSAERWAPLGPNAEFISEVANYKTEYLNIPVKDVEIRILNWLKRKK
jgi:ADP-heptose:LPS heptosyltransferase